MRILITGGTGFIGSHCADYYLNQGHDVVVMDNLETSSMDNLAHLSEHPRFTFINHDINDTINLDGDVDLIMQLASPANRVDYLSRPIFTMRTGSVGADNCLDFALRKNARILLASSTDVYGEPLQHPQKEAYLGYVDTIEEHAVYYGAKRYAESVTMAYWRTHDVQTYIARIANTYGPRISQDSGRVVSNFILQALQQQPLTIYGDGTQTRTFLYIDDLVAGMTQLVETDYAEPVNFAAPHEITMLQFAEVVNELTDNPAGIVIMPEKRGGGDAQRRNPDISLAKEVLNWEPAVSLSDGLKRTIVYFKEIIG